MKLKEVIARMCLDAIEEAGIGVMTSEGISESPEHTHFDIETEAGFFRIDVAPAKESGR